MAYSLFVFLAVLAVLSHPVHSTLVGGIEDVDKNDPDLLDSLDFALNALNGMSNNMFRYMSHEVTSATKQIVAGEKFCVVSTIGVSRSCRNDDEHKSATLEKCPIDTLEMQCRFTVLRVAWEGRTELLDHECVGLSERKLTCREAATTQAPVKAKEPVQLSSNVIEEIGESSKVNSGKEAARLEQFHAFVLEHKKPYIDDKKEYLKRFKIFQENVKKAKRIQEKDQGSAQYGVTQFSDLTEEEFKKTYLMPGWGKPEYEMKQAEIPKGTPPASFDWRTKGAVTPVKNQAQCGSCWAFSTTGNIEGQWAIKKNKLISLSEQELVDCDKVDEGCNGGLPSTAYKQIMKLGGLESEQEYPYEGKDDKCKFDKSEVVVTINGSVAISKDEKEMAAWLAQNGPISIGINANMMQFYLGGVAHPFKFLCNPSELDHGVLIVGYGVKSTWLHGEEPYWIIKNSWGPGWGEEGYYLIYRGDGSCGLNTACTSAVID